MKPTILPVSSSMTSFVPHVRPSNGSNFKRNATLNYELSRPELLRTKSSILGANRIARCWRKISSKRSAGFLHDLRGRVLGQPEISTDAFLPDRAAIRDAFGDNASHGVIVKTYSVTPRQRCSDRLQPRHRGAAVSRDLVSSDPKHCVSTNYASARTSTYVERQNLSLRALYLA
jgi:hypothetical protein